MSDLFLGPIDKQNLFTVAVPVFHDGVAALSLNATFAPERLAGLLAEQKLPPSWRAAIVDSQQIVVLRNSAQQRYVGLPVGAGLRQAMLARPEGDVESTTLDGIAVQTFFSRSPATGWSVAIGIPRDELTAGLRTHLLSLIGVGLTALLVGLLLATLLGKRLSGSVRMLRDEAGALGRGDIPRLPDSGFREARELGQAMVDAALRLKVAQDGLRESERRFSLVTRATGVGLWISEQGVEQLWASETWRAIFGYGPGEPVLRADLPSRIHADERETVTAGFSHALEEGQSYEAEFRLCLPDGSLRWVSARGQAERTADGLALMRGAAFDITARKSAELALEHKQQQLIHLARVSMLGELAGALAHELNQPLTAILSNAQAALRFLRRDAGEAGEVTEEVIEILQDIVDEDKHAGAVIRRLRTLLRPGETSAQYIDVNALVREASRLVRSELRQRGVELRTELAEALPDAVADPVQLQQVLINLLVNAGDAMAQCPAGERLVVIGTALQDGALRVSVRDAGSGLAPAVQAHIFDPFFTTKPQGMGLGLSICRTIIEANGGSLSAANNPGRGAVFSFTVPLAGRAP